MYVQRSTVAIQDIKLAMLLSRYYMLLLPKSAEGREVGVDVDGVGVAGEAVERRLVGGRLHRKYGS